ALLSAPVVAGIVSWVLLAVAAALPAFHVAGRAGRPGDVQGWVLLVFGWMGVFQGAAGWFANPCFFLATVAMMLRADRIAIPAGAAAVAFALMSFLVRDIRQGDLVVNGAIVGYGPGFFLWLSAMVLSFAAPTCFWLLSRASLPGADGLQGEAPESPGRAD